MSVVSWCDVSQCAREPADVFCLQDERRQQAQDVRIGARAGEDVVLEQREELFDDLVLTNNHLLQLLLHDETMMGTLLENFSQAFLWTRQNQFLLSVQTTQFKLNLQTIYSRTNTIFVNLADSEIHRQYFCEYIF